MKRMINLFLCFVLALGVLAGCGKEENLKEPFVYYFSVKESQLVREAYEPEGEGVEGRIEEVLALLREPEEPEDYQSVFLEGIDVERWELNDTEITLYFNEAYREIPAASEVILRSSVVRSLVQIDGVDYVQFYVKDTPLTNDDGREIGYMRAEDFVENTGSSLHSYQTANVILYFAGSTGDYLVPEEISVRYNSNMSIEKLIVEKLMSGPSETENRKVIPDGTKLLGVSVRDNVCYVNFDEGFLKVAEQVNPKITVYALVNSIIEGGATGKVQILVNGETDIVYQESIDLSKPLSKNADLIKEK